MTEHTAKHKDFVPGPDAQFNTFFHVIVQYVANKTAGTSPQWTHIPPDARSELNNAWNNWYVALEEVAGPHTSVQTAAKNTARKAGEHVLRVFINTWLRWHPAVTDDDRRAMSLPIHDGTPTTIGAPGTTPVLTGKALGAFRASLHFHDETTPDSRAIPYGCNGCLLYYFIGTEKLEDYALLKETVLMTHAPFTLQLGPEAEGKFLSCACRWQNEKGEKGPWSEIVHIAVS